MKAKKRKTRIKSTGMERIPVDRHLPIVADGAIAGPVAGGALVPVVIVDTTNRSDVAELIRVHEFLPPGDVVTNWALLDNEPDVVALILDFVRPVETRAVLAFSIESQGILVESTLRANSIYLQSGNTGDRFSQNLSNPRILVEVRSDTFRSKWDEVFLDRMTDVLRKRNSVPRRDAEELAARLIEQLRSLTSFRMPRK